MAGRLAAAPRRGQGAFRQFINEVATELEGRSRSFGYSLGAFGVRVALCAIPTFATAQHATLPPPPPATPETPFQPPASMNRREQLSNDNNNLQPTAPSADQTTSAQPPATTASPGQQSTSPVGAMPAPTVRMDNQRFAALLARTPILPPSQVGQDVGHHAKIETRLRGPKQPLSVSGVHTSVRPVNGGNCRLHQHVALDDIQFKNTSNSKGDIVCL